jgi:hypothetical protein
VRTEPAARSHLTSRMAPSCGRAFRNDARAVGLDRPGCNDGRMTQFDASDMAILELVAEDRPKKMEAAGIQPAKRSR